MADGRKNNGGSRDGAGRPRTADVFESEIATSKRRIADRLPELIDAQFDLALGVTVQEVDRENGGLVVYTRAPDAKAGQYLINRIMGMPTVRQELTGKDGEALLRQAKDLTDDELAAIIDHAIRSRAGATET